MGILTRVLTFPLMGPVGAVTWLAEQVLEQVEAEVYNEDAVRGQLVELELRFEMDEISEEEYFATEEALLERLKLIREWRAANIP